MLAILAFILMLSVLVIIHELGHFITARIFKVKIEEFGIGYPPKVADLFKWKGIPFTLNLIPIGGFVRMLGESEPGQSPAHSPSSTGHIGAFYSKPRWQRLIVVLAGATINFLFGVVAFAVIYSRLGIPTPVVPTQTQVVEVAPGPGKTAGLLPDDIIVSAKDSQGNAIEAHGVTQFTSWVRARPDSNLTLTISRAGKLQELKLHTRPASEITEFGAISVSLGEPIEAKFYPWYQMPFKAIEYGLIRSFDLTKLIVSSLGQMVGDLVSKGKVPTDVAGPIGIVSEVGKQKIFASGFLRALDFTALFSINLAIMNVLPIPALDGGRALFILLEYVIGRRRISNFEEKANQVGMVFLLILIFLISVKDIWQILH